MPTTYQATVTQDALNALANAFVNPSPLPILTAVRVLDENEDVISTQAADFTATPQSGFSEVSGTTVFGASSITADIHWFELLGPGGAVMARTEVDPPLPAGIALSLRTVNLIAPGD